MLVLVFKWSKNHGTRHYFVTKHLRILINQTSKGDVNSVETALATEKTATKFSVCKRHVVKACLDGNLFFPLLELQRLW